MKDIFTPFVNNMIELNKIYNEDCLIGMQRIPDKSVDMILTDLPYGTTRNKWDSVIPLEPLWKQYERIIKDDGAIVLTAQAPFDKVLGVSNLKLLRYEWIWKKTAGTGFLNAKKMPLKDNENILVFGKQDHDHLLVFYKKLPTYNPQMRSGFKPYETKKGNHGSNYNQADKETISVSNGERFPVSVLEFPKDTQKSALHPTQKPVSLFEYLIKTYTNENDTVLDSCSGSGTTAVACLNTNRNFICFEKEKEYHDLSVDRVENHVSQITLL
ncbi:site-specific DNA-methyltransferase (adenine-specific) [Enterococcus sp. 9E7_DIV0242]|nr:site-specific DNA-methyltransferase [Enterococcus sp. 9E7_DIV0242]